MTIISSKNPLLIISSLTVIGFAVRLYFALTAPLGWDGGIFLYWANLIDGGATPYRDFFVRDPVYIYLLALSVKILGPTYFAAFMISIIPGAATIPMIYKTATEIFDKGSGLIAALAYAVSPTVIWYNTVIDERTLMLFLSVCALWMLVRGFKTDRTGYFVAFGLTLGVATFAYRGVAIYIVTLPFLLGYLYLFRGKPTEKSLRLFLSRSAESLLAYALAAGAIFSYFSVNSSLSWMVSNFGFSGQQESASYFIYGEVVGLSFRLRIFDVFVREWLYLIAPAALTLMATFLARFFRSRLLSMTIALAVTSCFWALSVVGLSSQPQSANGAYEPTPLYSTSFILFLAILPIVGGVLYPQIAKRIFLKRSPRLGSTLAIYWLLSTILLISLFGFPLLNYYYYLAPIFAILAAPALYSVLRMVRRPSLGGVATSSRNHVLAVGLLGLLTINAAVTTGMLLNTQTTWRNVYPTAVAEIAAYIQRNTGPNDEILAGNPAIALFAHRAVALGITQMQIYWKTGPEPFKPIPYDPFQLFPNVSQIAQFMNQGNVKYVVGDNSPPILAIMSLHPLWESAFTTNFVLDTTIDGTPIYRYTHVSGMSQYSSEMSASPNPTVYAIQDRMWTDRSRTLSKLSWEIVPRHRSLAWQAMIT